jgi:hypothetical protein
MLKTADDGKRVSGEYLPERYRHVRVDRGKGSLVPRWWSLKWWRGHHLKHDACGEWQDKSKSHACKTKAGHDGAHEFRPVTAAAMRAERTSEYRAYIESRLDSAESVTKGVMVSEAGQRRGYTARSLWFSGRRTGSLKYATEEMRDWLADHGTGLSATEFARQSGHGNTAYAEYGYDL